LLRSTTPLPPTTLDADAGENRKLSLRKGGRFFGSDSNPRAKPARHSRASLRLPGLKKIAGAGARRNSWALIASFFFSSLTVELEQALAALDVGDGDGGLLPPEGLDALLEGSSEVGEEREREKERESRGGR